MKADKLQGIHYNINSGVDCSIKKITEDIAEFVGFYRKDCMGYRQARRSIQKTAGQHKISEFMLKAVYNLGNGIK